MRKHYIFFQLSMLTLLCVFNLFCTAQTDVIGDQGDSVWTLAKSPYTLRGNVTVPAGKTLTIQPGVEVRFPSTDPPGSNSQLIVQGTLNAVGSITDSIRFTGVNPLNTGDRRGPVTIEATSTNSILRYVDINALGFSANSTTTYGLIVRSATCLIENCRIRNTQGTALGLLNVAAIVRNNVFTANVNLDVNTDINNLVNLTGNNPLKIGLRNEVMTANASLPGGNIYYYLLGNLTVPSGQTLTIAPGVEVRFPSTDPPASYSQLIIQGTLNAVGTVADSIRFTGVNFLGSSDRRGPVVIEATSSNSRLRYVDINALGYSANSATSGGMVIRSASCIIENCLLRNTQGTALILENAAAIVRNNIFTANVNLDVNTGINNLPLITGNSPLKIGLRNEGMTANASLPGGNIYYYLLGNLTVPSGQTLTIAPGVEVRFPSTDPPASYSQLIIQGTLNAVGTVADSIRFTGVNFLGSSDRRGPVVIEATSSNSRLRYVDINALGYSANSATSGGMVIRSASCIIENCLLRNTQGTALILENAAAIVRNNIFTANVNLDVNTGVNNLPLITGNSPLKIGLRNEGMTANASLPGGNIHYYLLGDLIVPSGQTLTIAPGAEVRFPSTDPPASYSQLIIQGTLNAVGTIADSIRFTGVNFLGTGDRRGPVFVEATSVGSHLQYVSVNGLGYSQNSETAYTIIIRTSSCIIENCTISNSQGVGIFCLDTTVPTIKNNLYFDNTNGDIAGQAKSFTNISNNTNAKILVLPTIIDQNISVPYPGSNSYYALTGAVTIDQGANFIIAPGTIIDFRNNLGNIVVNGTLTAIGTETGKIQFKKITSGTNTTLGGTLSFTATSSGSVLKNILIDKLGNLTAPAKGSAIEINTSSVVLENINVTNSTTTGLKLNNITTTITTSNFLSNTVGVLSTGGQTAFNDCSFVGNSTIAIKNTSALLSDSIDARNCWWGAPSGPRHVFNLSGRGDTIDAKVRFLPFKTADAGTLVLCPGGNAFLQIAAIGLGYTYQWQVDTGTGFTNLANTSIYSGTDSTTLVFTGAPSTLYGYKYRVVAAFGGSSVMYSPHTITFGVNWTGTSDTAWENPANWSCGVVPDANTDVIVPGGMLNTPAISSNKFCRSLTLQNNASILVNTGFNLNISGK